VIQYESFRPKKKEFTNIETRVGLYWNLCFQQIGQAVNSHTKKNISVLLENNRYKNLINFL